MGACDRTRGRLRVLVTGATGFIGCAVVDRLVADDHEVVAVSRRQVTVGENPQIKWRRVADPAGPHAWADALSGVDAVIHLSARSHAPSKGARDELAVYRTANVATTQALAEQARAAGVTRFVFVSSVKAMGERTQVAFRETDRPTPEDSYGISKLESEYALAGALAGSGTTFTIVRPPLVYGPGVKANLRSLTRAVLRGWPLPFGRVQNSRSFLASANLADLLVHCLQHPAAVDATFLASDGEDLSTPDLIRRIASAAGLPARLVPVPVLVLNMGLRLSGHATTADKLLGSLVVDSTRVCRELDWQPPSSVDAALGCMTAEVCQANGWK